MDAAPGGELAHQVARALQRDDAGVHGHVMNRSKLILSVTVTLLLASAPAVALPRDNRANYGAIRAGETQATENQCEMYHNWNVEDTQIGSDKDAAFDKDLAASRGRVWAQRDVDHRPPDDERQHLRRNRRPVTISRMINSVQAMTRMSRSSSGTQDGRRRALGAGAVPTAEASPGRCGWRDRVDVRRGRAGLLGSVRS